jgi:putative FmdB family regulatory protein
MTYEYVCTACGHAWEAEQSISAAPLKTCPNCQQETAKRQISGGAGFILKGGGWYADLYGSPTKKASSEDKPASASDTKTSSDAKTSTSDTKTSTSDTKGSDKGSSGSSGAAGSGSSGTPTSGTPSGSKATGAASGA